ncbi:MAG: hypothetical protein QOE02_5472, partial [Rhodospirillaceae bacterium]|nr:hypothetical protein [Rhodospirillaceae bacterium]
ANANSQSVVASTRYLQKALASCIWRGVRHSASNSRGEATITQMHFAREVATFKRLTLWLFAVIPTVFPSLARAQIMRAPV